jgi:hypothetical protein
MMHLPRSFARSPHPLGPKVVFSYGMTKSGSTLAFELARSALELSGFPQPILPASATGTARKINFAGHLQDENIAELSRAVRDIGHPVVIKTHTRPDPCVIAMIDRGEAVAQASYRDPREMALSMIDHGNRSRAAGKPAFADIATLDDAMCDISSQIDSLTQWLYRPNCLPLYYEDVAFRSLGATRRILRQLQLEMPAARVLNHVLTKRFIQLNIGIKKRFKQEMKPADQRRFRQTYDLFHRHLISGRRSLPDDGGPILPQTVVLVPSRG